MQVPQPLSIRAKPNDELAKGASDLIWVNRREISERPDR
jgi:hypothetical protein